MLFWSATAVRLINPKYYSDSERLMLAALEDIGARGCKFIVAGRAATATAPFQTFRDLVVPAAVAHMFRPLAFDEFRVDVSSTDIRAAVSKLPTD